jgi:hypothetical protein
MLPVQNYTTDIHSTLQCSCVRQISIILPSIWIIDSLTQCSRDPIINLSATSMEILISADNHSISNGCNVNTWVYSHAAGPAELPVWKVSVPDLNSTSWTPSRRPACRFQCNCIGTCTRNLSVPDDCPQVQSAKIIILYSLSY